MSGAARFQSKIAFVTGAGSGIGRAVALRLASEGASVVAADLNGESARKTADEAASAGGKALGLTLDIADEAGVQAAIARCVAEFGGLDVLVNCAGTRALWADLSRPTPRLSSRP